MKLYNAFIHSDIFLSVAAVFLTVATQIQLGMKPHFQSYLFLIFFATLFEYNRHRFLELLTNKPSVNSEKQQWINQNLKKFYFLVFISVAGMVISVFSIKLKILIAFAPLVTLTFFYSVPDFGNKNYLFRLRQVPYLKIFLIVFVWSAATVLLPVIHEELTILNRQVILLFAERFFFIFAIAIHFDIRDMQVDKHAGLKTIPLLISRNKAISLSYFSLVICLVISVIHYPIRNNLFIIEALSTSLLITYLFFRLQFFKKLNRYYYQILDGTILIQGMLVLIFYFVNQNHLVK